MARLRPRVDQVALGARRPGAKELAELLEEAAVVLGQGREAAAGPEDGARELAQLGAHRLEPRGVDPQRGEARAEPRHRHARGREPERGREAREQRRAARVARAGPGEVRLELVPRARELGAGSGTRRRLDPLQEREERALRAELLLQPRLGVDREGRERHAPCSFAPAAPAAASRAAWARWMEVLIMPARPSASRSASAPPRCSSNQPSYTSAPGPSPKGPSGMQRRSARTSRTAKSFSNCRAVSAASPRSAARRAASSRASSGPDAASAPGTPVAISGRTGWESPTRITSPGSRRAASRTAP